jgi:hypothetical protein
VADGTGRVLLIPIEYGDPETVLDAWRHGRALLALARLQVGARHAGAAALAIAAIEAEVTAVRRDRRTRQRDA